MTMVKYFCDICGKEIDNGVFTKTILLKDQRAAIVNDKHILIECCDGCYKAISEFIMINRIKEWEQIGIEQDID